MRTYTRDELLALTPDRYLAAGYRDAAGLTLGELSGDFAMAAATQLKAAEASAQELAFTHEALKQVLALHDGRTPGRVREALDEALGVVAAMIRQPNNPGLVRWLRGLADFVRRAEDIDDMMAHILAVVRLYGVIAALPDRPEPLAEEPDARRSGADTVAASESVWTGGGKRNLPAEALDLVLEFLKTGQPSSEERHLIAEAARSLHRLSLLASGRGGTGNP